MVQHPEIQQRLLRVPEAARYLGMAVATVHRAIQRGEIPAVRIGRTLRVDREDLDKLIARRKKGVAV